MNRNNKKRNITYQINSSKMLLRGARQSRFIAVILILSILFTLIPPIPKSQAAPTTLADVNIGDIVVDNSWTWEYRIGEGYSSTGDVKPIQWIVVAKNHYGAGQVTLLSLETIALNRYDVSSNRGHPDGSSHWGNTGAPDSNWLGIRKFLNGSSYVGADNNVASITLYDRASTYFKSKIIPTTLSNVAHGGSNYSTTDNIFIPSQTELGGGATTSYNVGTVYEYFTTSADTRRMAEGVGNYYWTRSPGSARSDYVKIVIKSDGSLSYASASGSGGYGIRPALNIASDVALSGGSGISGNPYTIAPDSTPPIADITYNPAGPYAPGTEVIITATFNEPVADSPVPQISISGANTLVATNMTKVSNTVYTYNYTVGAGLGECTVAITSAQDMAGNTITDPPTSGATFIVADLEPPVNPTATPSTGTYYAAQTVTLSTISDDVTNIHYTLDGSDPDSGSNTVAKGGTITIDANNGETVTLKLICYDTSGNASGITTYSYTFEKTLPPSGYEGQGYALGMHQQTGRTLSII